MAEEHGGFNVGDKACVNWARHCWHGDDLTVTGFEGRYVVVCNHTSKVPNQRWPAAMLVKIQDTGCEHKKHDDTDGGMLDRDTAGLNQPLRSIMPAAAPHEPPPWHLVEAAQDRRTLWGAR